MPILLPDFPSFSSLVALDSVVRTGSFAAAGRELHVSEVAINRKVAELEAWLGTDLVVRRRPRIVVTDDAKAIASVFRNETQKIRDELSRIRRLKRSTNRVTVYVSTAFSLFWLSPRIHRLHDQHPNLELNIVSNVRSDRFDPEECDMAIVYTDQEIDGFENILLFHDDIVPVASPQYLKSRKRRKHCGDFSQDTLLCLAKSNSLFVDWDFWFEATGYVGQPGQHREVFNDYGPMIMAAIEGIGVAMGFRRGIALAIEDRRLVEVVNTSVPAPGDYKLLVSKKRKRNSPETVAVFRDWIIGEARKGSET